MIYDYMHHRDIYENKMKLLDKASLRMANTTAGNRSKSIKLSQMKSNVFKTDKKMFFNTSSGDAFKTLKNRSMSQKKDLRDRTL